MQNLDWQYEAQKIFGLLLAALLIGWIIGFPGWSLFFAALAYIIWSLRQLHRLQHWLASPGYDEPPQGDGLWGGVLDSIYHRQSQFKEERIRLQGVVDYLRDSFASLADAVVMIDDSGQIVWSNQASEQLLGLRYPEDTGQQWINLIRSPDFIKYYETGDYSKPLSLRSPQNPRLQLIFQITFFGKGSRLLFVRDVTENFRLQQMRSDFVANVSHELRTPLTVIIGYLSHFLPLETNDDKQDKAFRQMFIQASRMERLVKDLLLLSRLETLPEITRQQDIQLLPVMEMIREEILAAVDNQRSIDIECDNSLRLKGSLDELRSAFSNLVMNAAKYTEVGGHIQVRWFADAKHAFFEVEDNGIGIENQHLTRLTERFYRVDKGRSIDTGGTGLGLAIVKHVLIRHDAELIIHSNPGEGSLFRCVFPLSQTALEKPVDPATS